MKIAPLTLGLGVSMTCGYGALYYSFGVLAPEIARHFQWDNSFVFGVFSAGLLASAFLSPLCGRLVDRFGARPVMSIGAALSALLLALHGLAEQPMVFAALMALIPLVSIAVLYETGFTALTQLYGAASRSHMTAVTLVAGFASTIFWPLCQWLLTVTDWRGTYLVIAAVYAIGALPVHLALPRAAPLSHPMKKGVDGDETRGVISSPDRRRKALILMSVTLAAAGFMISAMSTVLMVLLTGAGFSAASATLIGSCVGPAQVVARLLDFGLRGAMTPMMTAIVSSAATLLSVLTLGLAQSYPVLAIGLLFGVLMGCGQGLNSIVRGVLPLHFFGTDGYGKLTGNMSLPRIVCAAAAPVSVVFVQDHFGLRAALVALAVVALIAFLTVLALARLARPQ